MAKPDWINVSPQSGTGGREVQVTASNMASAGVMEDRSGTLTVKTTSGITKQVSVFQQGPESSGTANLYYDFSSIINEGYDDVTGLEVGFYGTFADDSRTLKLFTLEGFLTNTDYSVSNETIPVQNASEITGIYLKLVGGETSDVSEVSIDGEFVFYISADGDTEVAATASGAIVTRSPHDLLCEAPLDTVTLVGTTISISCSGMNVQLYQTGWSPGQEEDNVLVAECQICGYNYVVADGAPESGIKAGTPWSKVPDSFTCPDCCSPKSDFIPTVFKD